MQNKSQNKPPSSGSWRKSDCIIGISQSDFIASSAVKFKIIKNTFTKEPRFPFGQLIHISEVYTRLQKEKHTQQLCIELLPKATNKKEVRVITRALKKLGATKQDLQRISDSLGLIDLFKEKNADDWSQLNWSQAQAIIKGTAKYAKQHGIPVITATQIKRS